MLPSSINLNDWINPIHLENNELWTKNQPFLHFIVPNFFKMEVFKDLRKYCLEIDPFHFEEHPTGGYKFAAMSSELFFMFMYSNPFKQLLKSKLSFNFHHCKAFPCPQIYQFNVNNGVVLHNDYDPKKRRDFGMIIYMHSEWQPHFGGELLLFDKGNLENPHTTILPMPNTLVGFQVSPDSYHSVNPALSDWKRMSIVVDWNITF